MLPVDFPGHNVVCLQSKSIIMKASLMASMISIRLQFPQKSSLCSPESQRGPVEFTAVTGFLAVTGVAAVDSGLQAIGPYVEHDSLREECDVIIRPFAPKCHFHRPFTEIMFLQIACDESSTCKH